MSITPAEPRLKIKSVVAPVLPPVVPPVSAGGGVPVPLSEPPGTTWANVFTEKIQIANTKNASDKIFFFMEF